MLHRFLQLLSSVERRFYAWCHEMRAERTPPINYKSIFISNSEIQYVESSKKAHTIPFDSIVMVEFVREEALFPCFDGPYLETKWIVKTIDGSSIEVMDEAPHRRKLLNAFSRSLGHFDSSETTQGMSSDNPGRWLCFQKSES
jgi:hypothetical protein